MIFVRLLLFLLVCLAGPPAVAAPAAPLLVDYNHKAWRADDDVPQNVMKFAQTPDGWLWIATATGLWRFDGIRFERASSVYGQRLKSDLLMGVNTMADGALVVAYTLNGISIFRKGQPAQSFAEADGLPSGMIYHIEPAPDGYLWLATRDGVARLAPNGKRFEVLGLNERLPVTPAYHVLFARDGATWVATKDGVFFRPRNSDYFKPAWPRQTLYALGESPDGTLWGADGSSRYYRLRTTPPASAEESRSPFAGSGMRFDRNGVMWVLHGDAVERRLSIDVDDPSQRLTPQTGLSGIAPGAIFEDREGNIWVGTATGIDRLRANRFRSVLPNVVLDEPTLLEGADGQVWVGDSANPLRSLGDSDESRVVAEARLSAGAWAADGALWYSWKGTLYRRASNGRITTYTGPDAVQGRFAQAIQPTGDGSVWIAFFAGGLYKVSKGSWQADGGLAGFPAATTVSMALDGRQQIWMGHSNNTISVVSQEPGGRIVQTLGSAQGLNAGIVYRIYRDGDTMWVTGEHGVFLYRQGRFTQMTGEKGELFRAVSGIVRLPNGELWLNGVEGAYRIGKETLAAWLAGRAAGVEFERFGSQDGIQGHASGLAPSMYRSASGRLWLATSNAIATIDPARIPRNPLAPTVLVHGVESGGRHFVTDNEASLVLPKGSKEMVLSFTALNLSMPERVRFRYRLVGLDDKWQQPVGRREAYYTNLAPGDYRFEVLAANEDGVWNTQGAALDIHIPPTFTQTRWFTALLSAALMLAAWGAYLLRIRVVTRRVQDRFVARMAERSRIARTLHDTLLQSIQGLILSFQSSAEAHPPCSPERQRMEQKLDIAEKLLEEGRDQIMDLRAASTPDELAVSLRRFGKQLASAASSSFSMQAIGKPLPLQLEANEEVYAIAREALVNAARHAEADHIWLELNYQSRSFSLAVRDDGKGLAPDVLRAGCCDGHWGLVGMRERAEGIGGRLVITSMPGKGTEITVVVPAKNAYDTAAATR
jgi:signal transduction histidine kinase